MKYATPPMTASAANAPAGRIVFRRTRPVRCGRPAARSGADCMISLTTRGKHRHGLRHLCLQWRCHRHRRQRTASLRRVRTYYEGVSSSLKVGPSDRDQTCGIGRPRRRLRRDLRRYTHGHYRADPHYQPHCSRRHSRPSGSGSTLSCRLSHAGQCWAALRCAGRRRPKAGCARTVEGVRQSLGVIHWPGTGGTPDPHRPAQMLTQSPDLPVIANVAALARSSDVGRGPNRGPISGPRGQGSPGEAKPVTVPRMSRPHVTHKTCVGRR
jgi:hypothetical protein